MQRGHVFCQLRPESDGLVFLGYACRVRAEWSQINFWIKERKYVGLSIIFWWETDMSIFFHYCLCYYYVSISMLLLLLILLFPKTLGNRCSQYRQQSLRPRQPNVSSKRFWKSTPLIFGVAWFTSVPIAPLYQITIKFRHSDIHQVNCPTKCYVFNFSNMVPK